jgi:hypothetical protein
VEKTQLNNPTTMRFKRRAPLSRTEASLTKVNASFKADLVLTWFRGDFDTTQSALGCGGLWPGAVPERRSLKVG